jgi:NitT/TauT family transport system permease protein
MRRTRFTLALPTTPPFTVGDGAILFTLAGLMYLATRLAFHAPTVITGPTISLEPSALPWYALLSVGRMSAAYALSLLFSLSYGYIAARRHNAEKVLMPLLDVLQSVPILSFLPVVLLGLSVFLSANIAAELAAVVLIFTSQAWNMTFSVYQSIKTIPGELREAAAIFRLSPWLRFRLLEVPFAATGIIWNSMVSWAGGWFFLMAAEMFTVGSRDFRIPGLGSYLQTAANAGDIHAVLLGVATLILVIVTIDQLLWRPLLVWAQRFNLETVGGSHTSVSWFHTLLSRSWLVKLWLERVWWPFIERLDIRLTHPTDPVAAPLESVSSNKLSGRSRLLWGVFAVVVSWGSYRAAELLTVLEIGDWLAVATGLGATFLRVCAALLIALLWTIPVGVMIGTRPKLAAMLLPIAQIAASVPATALFPIVLLSLLHLPGGLDVAAVLLMLLGTQWYLLFNVIAGASTIPQDLRDTTALLRLSNIQRWRTLYLPVLFPYIVTGAITAGGGAWNASIVAEAVVFGGETHHTTGIGAVIAQATANGNYALLLAATLAMVVTAVLINRLFWLRLYRLAEDRYHLD